MEGISQAVLKTVYPGRKPWVHKGQFGKLLVVAGSEMHTGSPVFAAMAAYRAGCDLVYLASPQRPADVAAHFSPNLITLPLEGKMLVSRHVPKILDLVKTSRITAMLIGPGLWRDRNTFKAIYQLIEKIDLPMVIDADAIRAVALKKNILKGKEVVLTPHANEFLAIGGKKVDNNLQQRTARVKQLAEKLCAVVLLKGNVDVISNGKRVVFNKTGCVYMTKGGFGDTLAGITSAFLARGVSSFDSASAAAYINGKAGELAAKKFGEGVLATDLLWEISRVIR